MSSKIDGVPRELLEQALSGSPVKPTLVDYCCVGCGNWMPHGHPEAHEHEDGCLEEVEAERRHWTTRLRDLLANADVSSTDEGDAPAAPVAERQEPLPGDCEPFQKWVMATKHPVFGFLDDRSLARSDDLKGYADEYVQGLWVAYKEFALRPASVAVVVERDDPGLFEIVGRQCFPSAEMAAVKAYRKEPWVDGKIQEQPSTPDFYSIEPLIRLKDAQSEVTALRNELAETQAISQQEELRANGYATTLVASENRNAELSRLADIAIKKLRDSGSFSLATMLEAVLNPKKSGGGA